MNNELYYFDKIPTSQSGRGISIIPGLGDWVLVHANVRAISVDAIPASKVREFLEREGK